ncbi:MAG: hypothetical protein GTO51_00330 [Candidatus Latescibacteria bacterium]|nr:hypothetical protein [Candidatus Latescibacterota bacterium]NIM64428.1 hypothetical protein [Candidatus Latescibacterota bacterium]NIO00582.1 hypothetical protein [Candidatus Latescibacterota bacterium]NIO26982.1 hypothetical protein [Candidatus Latescibacterota bacterium]NIO56059.1 hypothetical protein [Candidatus Latescibacterota bacterium]
MDLVSKDELKALIDVREGPCISLYMPTFKAGRQVEQNRIRYKNLLRSAERRLLGYGMRSKEVRFQMDPFLSLLEDSLFWQYQCDGLAIFASREDFCCYRLPLSFNELVVVTDRFHIKPLLPLLYGDGRFYVLAISQNNIRLFQSTRDNMNEMKLSDSPRSLGEALKYDLNQKQLQFHTGTPPRTGKRDAVYYGTGAGDFDVKNAILRYFRDVDKGIHYLLKEERAPLILAGVDYLFPIYKETNSYPYLMDNGIAGNPEKLNLTELHDRAWQIVQPYFQKEKNQAEEKCAELRSIKSKLISNDVREIAPAAFHARIKSLFVAIGIQLWGSFNLRTSEVYLHDEPATGDEDLLDFSAIHTFLNGGFVYAAAPEQIPNYEPLAAVFRY